MTRDVILFSICLSLLCSAMCVVFEQVTGMTAG